MHITLFAAAIVFACALPIQIAQTEVVPIIQTDDETLVDQTAYDPDTLRGPFLTVDNPVAPLFDQRAPPQEGGFTKKADNETSEPLTWSESAHIRIESQESSEAGRQKLPAEQIDINDRIQNLKNKGTREKLKFSRNEVASLAVGAGVQAGTWIADHHMFKDAKVDRNVAMIANDAEHGGDKVKAVASAPKAEAYHMRSGFGVKVGSVASVGHARAQSGGIPGTGDLYAAFAEAEAPNAKSQAEASCLGVKVAAKTSIGHVAVGFDGSPARALASGPTVGASAGIHASLIGASVEAHAGEVSLGPFAVRAGVKFGGGIENGIPVRHLGPVSIPCSIL